jgi:hypothetical protein
MKLINIVTTVVFGSFRRFPVEQKPFSTTSLYCSDNDYVSNNDNNQIPKNFLSPYDNNEKIFSSLFPISFILATFLTPQKEKTVPSSSISSPANITYTDLKDVINNGKVFVINDFIDSTIIQGLRTDINQLVESKQFAPSGLSNRAKGVKQEFSKKDRSVSPVTFDSANNSKSLLLVGEYIDQLRLKLAVVMNRPSMADIKLGHESYFSRSLPGMCDDRHHHYHHHYHHHHYHHHYHLHHHCHHHYHHHYHHNHYHHHHTQVPL